MNKNILMQHAYLVSQNSTCCSWKVGCIIEKDGRIISSGYNGVPKGKQHCCDHAHSEGWLKDGLLDPEKRPLHSAWSDKNEVHAEINAIMFAAKAGISIEGANMWCTASPCPHCAKAIANSGIKKLYFCEQYDRNAVSNWDDILIGTVEIEQIDKEKLNMLNFDTVKNRMMK